MKPITLYAALKHQGNRDLRMKCEDKIGYYCSRISVPLLEEENLILKGNWEL